MKTKRRNGDIFNLSFLDIICCGFGAMVLLVLLSNTDIGGKLSLDKLKTVLIETTAAKNAKIAAEQTQVELREEADELQTQLAQESPQINTTAVNRQLAEARARAELLRARTRDTIAQSQSAVKVGGIAVDGEYIIFVIDTSGSMRQIWGRVLYELENVISIHPKVKGFQMLNDNGQHLLKRYTRKWIPDTAADRRAAIAAAKKLGAGFSNSSPIEGIERALRTYGARTEKLSIYVFGDDYSGGSFDVALKKIARLNRDSKTGKPRAQINGIGFPHLDPWPADRFATLMREMARQNGGAFVALTP